MPIQSICKELRKIARLLNYWQAELLATTWFSAAAGILWFASLSDVFVQYGNFSRAIFCVLTLGVCGVGIWKIRRALYTVRSLESVAARIEQVFPQLDNRLINVLQFSLVGTSEPMGLQYIKQGVPNWEVVKIPGLRDRQSHKRAYIGAAVAVVLIGVPFLWMPESWSNAMARILNPFSTRPASVLAQVREVLPGNVQVISGQNVTLRVAAAGKAGQTVRVNLWPQDDHPRSVTIGKLTGVGVEEFSYDIQKVNAPIDYQMQAGDSVSKKFHVAIQLPISVKKLDVIVTPRKETGRPEKTFNGLVEQVVLPHGADMKVHVVYNRPVVRAIMVGSDGQSIPLTDQDHGLLWVGGRPVETAGPVMIVANGEGEEKISTSLKVSLEPDRPPVIKIIAPVGNVFLAAGAVPSIQWEASDDFGLTKVYVEQVATDSGQPGESAETQQNVLQEWVIADNAKSASGTWKGDGILKTGQSAGFRIVAVDNFGPGAPHVTRSAVIVFQPADTKKQADDAAKRADETELTLAKLVEAQKKNLEKTDQFSSAINSVKPEQWTDVQDVQKEIRRITGVLLADPKKPLAELHEKVVPLYQDQMLQAVNILVSLPTADAAAKPAQLSREIQLQNWILHVLSGVLEQIPSAEKNQQITDVLSMMDLIVKGQTDLVKTTKEPPADSKASGTLAKKQDRLAGDVDQFVAAAKDSAANLKGTDASFSELLTKVIGEMGTRKVTADMLLASEQLDAKDLAKALPFEENALKNLLEIQSMLNSWRVGQAEKKQEELVATIQKDINKLDKMCEMQKKVIDSMRAMKATENKTTEREDDIRRELEKKQKALEEALLKVATDLHIFPDANVGNEVAQEIVTRVTNLEQEKDSEHMQAVERALQKEDWILKDMEKVAARAKDGLAFLLNTPNNVNAITENFDKQEMKTMAMVPLDNKVEDLIGELMKQDKDIYDKTKSSATNQAVKDAQMEGPVAEGEWANYSAKGKSGNTEPKHNEQSGRSNIGRQGQSNGETGAAAGKINKGDDKLDNRMTQDSAQSGEMGKIDDSEAKTVATGGGKMSGTADEMGMSGQGPRRDSKDSRGTLLGEQALMRKKAETIYAAASLQHVRTGSLDSAIRHMRDAEEAIRDARPIEEVREHRRQATESLRKTQAELAGGISSQSVDPGMAAAKPEPDRVAGAADEAPAAYQGMVSDYYKAISNGSH